MKQLLNTLPQVGKVEWIGLRLAKRADMQIVESAKVTPEDGFIGDRYHGKSGKRQVTLIQQEHLEAVAKFLSIKEVDVALTRRNILVSGINLLALKDHQFSIGKSVVLETTGHCHPCSRMEENFGVGGYNAMRGHGGLTTRVIKGGTIKIGDTVRLISND
ncbi:MAG: MOSC domain-containing protein YiiM [Paraglaciecola sp.]|jgi:MOSC domain-containing protein YiiM